MKSKHFASALISIVAITAVGALGFHAKLGGHEQWPTYEAQSVTKVDNLTIAGTTDATGLVTARAGLALTSPTGSTVKAGTGDPNGLITAPRGSIFVQVDIPQVWMNLNAGTTWTTNISTIPGTGGLFCPSGQYVYDVTTDGTAFCGANLVPNTCAAGKAFTATDSSNQATCSTFFNTAGDHLSSSGSTVSLADVATQSFLGRTTAGTGAVETLTATQATALLNTFTSLLKGLVPASGGGTTTYLRADGTWATPPGSGGTVTSVTGGTSISTTGTTAVVVDLNFPTTACTSGMAIVSHATSGAPTCATFFDTAGDHLTSSGSTVRLADVATQTFLGRTSSSTGVVETLTATQATAILDQATATLKGLVPTPPNDTTKFLRGDATWAAPSSSGAAAQVDTYDFANTGSTWNMPAGAKTIEVITIGGGGGGGGGKQGAAGLGRTGGGGGGGGFVATGLFRATDCPSSALITVGTGGAGGSGGSSPSNGSPGGTSDFGGRLFAYGGGAGQAGQSNLVAGGGGGGGGAGAGTIGSQTSNNGGSPACTAAQCISMQGSSGGLSPAGKGEWGGGGGGRSNFGVGAGATGGGSALYGGAGGGGGGQVNSNNLNESSGGRAGSSGVIDSSAGGSGAGGAANSDGSDGVAWGPYAGGGGGGGGPAATGTAGKGGKGFIGCGGGGGGGAGATATANSGGSGGSGRVIVITYF